MMDWVDYPNIDAAHQMMPNTLLPVTAAAMGGVQDYAMPPPTVCLFCLTHNKLG